MACMMHAAVGLQHGSMAVYNAYADRVPIFLMTGAWLDATRRDGEVVWTLRQTTHLRWCATSPNGTTRLRRCDTLPNLPYVHISFR